MGGYKEILQKNEREQYHEKFDFNVPDISMLQYGIGDTVSNVNFHSNLISINIINWKVIRLNR